MIEVLKQALDALECGNTTSGLSDLRQVIAELESQEPVAWRDRTYGTLMHQEWQDADPLYTHPPQRKPLTDAECDDLWDTQLIHITDKVSAKQFIRDIEAAHGIKEQS